MENFIGISQLVFGIFLIVLILIQPKGKGLGRGVSANSFTRRGVERLIYRLTFVVAFIFIALSIAALIV